MPSGSDGGRQRACRPGGRMVAAGWDLSQVGAVPKHQSYPEDHVMMMVREFPRMHPMKSAYERHDEEPVDRGGQHWEQLF
jgi:hypothetical protein